ncbi:hypothetical protein A9Q81_06250 [Gammaproteobacteria bacterium 42_54_T18]|nr:hypothetical protein A9Q81_06250 [Gammaproteobacteria bacterium 42_54_T18]
MNHGNNDDTIEESQFIQGIKKMVNEQLREKCSLLISKSLEKVAIDGYHAGSIAPFGYQSVKVDAYCFGRTITRMKLKIHNGEFSIVNILFCEAIKLINEDNLSYAGLARKLNEMNLLRRGSKWTGQNVKNTLIDPSYCGEKIYGNNRSKINAHKQPIKIKCPAIVTKDIFNKVYRYIAKC